MNIAIEKPSDFSDVEVTTSSQPREKFSVSRDIDCDGASESSRHATSPKRRPALETAGVDLLVNEPRRQSERGREGEHERVEIAVEKIGSPTGSDHFPKISIENIPTRHGSSHDPKPADKSPRHDGDDGWGRHSFTDAWGTPGDPAGQEKSNQSTRAHGWEADFDTRSQSSNHGRHSDGFVPENVDRQKREILRQLDRLEKKGVFIGKQFTMSDSLTEMKYEYEKLRSERETDAGVKTYKHLLAAFVNGAETLNTSFNPYPYPKLNGWAESVTGNMDAYDDVLEDLHHKWASKTRIPPELRLLGLLGMSAIQTNMINTFKESMPGIGDIMKDDPDLTRHVQEAAARKAKSYNMFGQQRGGGGGGGGGERPPSMPAHPRQEMRPPSNVEDILKKFSKPSAHDEPTAQPGDDKHQKRPVPEGSEGASMNLSELHEFDKMSDVSSLPDAGAGPARPSTGMRPTRPDAFKAKLQSRKSSKRSPLIIDF